MDEEEYEGLTEIEQKDIQDLRKHIRYFTKIAQFTMIIALVLMLVAICLATFSLWIKLALISILLVVVSSGSYKLTQHMSKNNIIRSNERWT